MHGTTIYLNPITIYLSKSKVLWLGNPKSSRISFFSSHRKKCGNPWPFMWISLSRDVCYVFSDWLYGNLEFIKNAGMQTSYIPTSTAISLFAISRFCCHSLVPFNLAWLTTHVTLWFPCVCPRDFITTDKLRFSILLAILKPCCALNFGTPS